MGKYIDAEKLKRFVESIGLTPQKSADYNDGRDDVKMVVLDFIDSLQQEQPIKVYRVENEKEQKGLWRKFDGTWEPLFDMLTDGQCKDMPMEDNPIYREGGKQWFASAPSKETLQKWFSKRDLEELTAKGFTISEFEVVGHKKVSDFEYIFTRDNIINRAYLKVSDIYPQEQPEVDLERPIPKDLEEASSKFATHTVSNGVSIEFLEEKLSFQEGAKWAREQIMKNAKDGWMDEEDVIILNDGTRIDLQPDYDKKPAFEFEYAQNVQVIVLPKEN